MSMVINPFSVVPSGPVITAPTAFWRMDDANDSAGSTNLTNNNAVTFVSGKVGNAANFNNLSSQTLSHVNDAVFQLRSMALMYLVCFYIISR